jgi:hypothetical protein
VRAIFIAAEPGGATTLAPVARRLDPEPPIYCPARCAPGFSNLGLHPTVLPDPGDAAEALAVVRCLVEQRRPQVVVTSLLGPPDTSLDRAAARLLAKGGPAHLAVLDSWTLLAERFDRDGGGFTNLPSAVALPDAFTRDELAGLGFPAERLAVTGHPFFDEIVPAQRPRPLGRPPRVGFLLQPFTELVRLGHLPSPGYAEAQAAAVFFAALEQAGPDFARSSILLREHPRRKSVYTVPEHLRGRTSVSSSRDGWEFTMTLDVVVGMNSTLLLYAFLAGIPTLTCQPGPDPLPEPCILQRFGLVSDSPTPASLAKGLSWALSPDFQLDPVSMAGRRRFPRDGQCCARVIKLMEALA